MLILFGCAYCSLFVCQQSSEVINQFLMKYLEGWIKWLYDGDVP